MISISNNEDHLRAGRIVTSADNIAATVKASDKHPSSFASINVLASEGSNGSSKKTVMKHQITVKTCLFERKFKIQVNPLKHNMKCQIHGLENRPPQLNHEMLNTTKE